MHVNAQVNNGGHLFSRIHTRLEHLHSQNTQNSEANKKVGTKAEMESFGMVISPAPSGHSLLTWDETNLPWEGSNRLLNLFCLVLKHLVILSICSAKVLARQAPRGGTRTPECASCCCNSTRAALTKAGDVPGECHRN